MTDKEMAVRYADNYNLMNKDLSPKSPRLVVGPTAIEKMSDNELCRKLDIARRNIEKWQKREKDIQFERSRRYRYYKSMQDTEW
jgi:hypothetical protein